MLIYVKDRSGHQQRKLPKQQREEYAAWCKTHGLDPVTGKPIQKAKPIPRVTKHASVNPLFKARMAASRSISSVDSGITGAVASRSMMDPIRWRGEDEKVVEEIVAKSKRLAPAYSKGAVQYITDGMDPSDLGRKK